MPNPKPLTINSHRLHHHAQAYGSASSDNPLLGDDDPRFPHAGDEIRARGHIQADEFKEIARWKSPRAMKWIESNPDRIIERVTGLALALKDTNPDYATSLLTVLKGVNVPTASVILTVVDPRNFGIIDIRAWQTLSRWRPNDFSWKGRTGFRIKEFVHYLKTIRRLARDSALLCREVDMALWHMAGEI